ncbi:hypothetical protein PV328_010892 [Microctonus aethiopoides]|uniref:WD repeat-containing protein n=1 Tax=Microctonus aethiopoides TaxID=144406 RepID=A0AA39FIY6_9HYME|nr:hypothetical protein PV328_010892 [Microctonus aethiopoides]
MSELDCRRSLKENTKRWRAILNDITVRSIKRDEQLGNVISNGVKDIKLYHGLTLISSIKLLGEYLNVCYCSSTQEYLVLDDCSMVHRYSIQGKYILPPFPLMSSMAFTKMIWCTEIKIFACFVPDNDLMWILSPQFKLIHTIRSEFKVKNLFYLFDSNELLVIGSKIITRYLMRHMDQTLDCYKTINLADDYSGPLWVINQSSLIDHEISSLKIVVSYLTTIYIFPIDHDEGNAPIKFITRKLNASSSIITALYYHSTSQWIISGDEEGIVLGWSLSLECTLKCLDGHRNAVKLIISHPSICGFITSSKDDVLQVWSCNLRQKLESFTELGEIFSMAINPVASSMVTLGRNAPAIILFSASNHVHPTRIFVKTLDNNIYILSSVSGRQLNMGILPENVIPVSIAYSAITKSMYMVSSDTGNILISTIETCPMELKKTWKTGDKKITCIVVYDYYDEIYGLDRKLQKPNFVCPIRARIIVGMLNGEMASVNETTGKYEKTIRAHNGEVKKLYASTVSGHIFSMGEDKCVKVWRMLPNIVSSLALLHYIYYLNPITNIASMGFTICISSNNTNLQSHQLLMYDIKERIPREHHPSKDHIQQILGIATSESLLICATSSEDNTIRIWNQENDLIKILELNIRVRELTFSSRRGDIIFSVGKHLYRLPYENYLSVTYRTRILNNNIFDEEEEEEPMMKYDKNGEYEKEEDKIKIVHPVNSVQLGSLDPTMNTPCLQSILQQHMCMQIESRDEDIIKIKDGIIPIKKIIKKKSLTYHEEWTKYEDELFGLLEQIEKEAIPPHDVRKSIENYKNVKKILNIPTLQKKIEYVGNFIGYVPNSMIVKTLVMKKLERMSYMAQEKKKFKYIYPDELQGDRELLDDSSLFSLSMLEDLNNL